MESTVILVSDCFYGFRQTDGLHLQKKYFNNRKVFKPRHSKAGALTASSSIWPPVN